MKTVRVVAAGVFLLLVSAALSVPAQSMLRRLCTEQAEGRRTGSWGLRERRDWFPGWKVLSEQAAKVDSLDLPMFLQTPRRAFFPFERSPSTTRRLGVWLPYVATADVDGDSLPDIFVFGRAEKIWLYRNSPEGLSREPLEITVQDSNEYYYTDLAIADFDLDGDQDLAIGGTRYTGVSSYGNPWYSAKGVYVWLLKNDGGHFDSCQVVWADTTTPPSSAAIHVKPYDVNMDGRPDLVVYTVFSELVNYPIQVFLNSLEGFPTAPNLSLVHERYDAQALTMFDVNGDNYLDLFVSVDPHCVWWWPIYGYVSEGGTLPEEPNWESAHRTLATAMCSGDIDGDGDPDLCTTYWKCWGKNRTESYLNLGSTLAPTSAPLASAFILGTHDFDGDGLEDLYGPAVILQNKGPESDPQVAWRPNWFLKSELEGTLGCQPWGRLSLADVDGDGATDLCALMAHYDEHWSEIRVFLAFPNDSIPPEPPQWLRTAWNEEEATIELSWRGPAAADDEGYLLYYATDPSDTLFEGRGLQEGDSPIMLARVTSVKLHGASLGTQYRFVLCSIDKGGWVSKGSAVAQVVPQATPPEPPRSFSVQELKDGVLYFEWESSNEADVSGYRLYCYDENRGETYSYDLPDTFRSHLTGFPLNTRLAFWITAVDRAGAESLPSDTVSVVPQPSRFRFEDVTASCGISMPGAEVLSAADFDQDGRIDMVFGGIYSRDGWEVRIYKNLSTPGMVAFLDVTQAVLPEIPDGPRSPYLVDVDNDGDLDLFLLSYRLPSLLFLNRLAETGSASFEKADSVTFDVSQLRKYECGGATFADFDGDGDLDMLVATSAGLRLFRNEAVSGGGHRYTAVPLVSSLSADTLTYLPVAIDLDKDDDVDAICLDYKGYVWCLANLGGPGMGQRFLTHRIKDDVTGDYGWLVRHWGIAWGDLDSDGDPDLYVPVFTGVDNPSGLHRLYLNTSRRDNLQFREIAAGANVQGEPKGWDGWGKRSASGVVMGDLDCDGKVDIFVAAGDGCNESSSVLYRNVRVGENLYFVNVARDKGAEAVSPLKRGTIAFDADSDGDLDIVTVIRADEHHGEQWPGLRFLRNQYGDDGRYLEILLNGKVSNTYCVGAELSVYAEGALGNLDGLIARDWVTIGTSHVCQSPYWKHFGLGEKDFVDLRIEFPSGYVLTREHVATNQALIIEEPELPSIASSFPDTLHIVEDGDSLFLPWTSLFRNPDSARLEYDCFQLTTQPKIRTHTTARGLWIAPVPDAWGTVPLAVTARYGETRYTVGDTMLVIIAQVNDPPEVQLPDTLWLPKEAPSTLVNVWEYAEDKETPDSLLTYRFGASTSLLHLTFDSTSGVLRIRADQSFQGRANLWILVADDSGAVASDTAVVARSTAQRVSSLQQGEIPQAFELLQNYPNPFSTRTWITLSVPKRQRVKVEVFDALGRRVALIADGELQAGSHRFPLQALKMPSGTYICRATGETFRATKKIVVRK